MFFSVLSVSILEKKSCPSIKKGRELLLESGAKKLVDDNKEELLENLKTLKYPSAYDV